MKSLLSIIAIFILVATNPTLERHQKRVSEVWAERLNAQAATGSFFDKLGRWIGATDFAASAVALEVQRGNFLVFSVGLYEGKLVSIGALNCVLVL